MFTLCSAKIVSGTCNPLVIVGKPHAFYLSFVVVRMRFFVSNIAI